MGKPAARLGDMHVCPMVTPALPPVPHVGGPIISAGVPTVLIGGMPAAVMGDMCTCTGPPDSILIGSMGVLIGGKPAARMGDQCAHGGSIVVGLPTVLIGESGGGGGGGGGMSPEVAKVVSSIKKTLPASSEHVVDQIIALKKAAVSGSAFCEVCKAKN